MRALDPETRRRLALHFDPDEGAPFWIERAQELGLDPDRDLRTEEDLVALGPFRRSWLVERPLLDFVPRRWAREPDRLRVVETGGTTGRPVATVFLEEELDGAFVEPFARAAQLRGFPPGGRWLFLGPSGPHAIGRAARRLARRMGAMEPHFVDLDPRWARAQEPGSVGERLYVEHVIEQALAVFEREPVDRLFATPPLLLGLAGRLTERERSRVRGIHPGGLPLAPESRRRIEEAFAQAVVLPAWGNALFGILPEAAPLEGAAQAAFVPCAASRRLIVRLVPDEGDPPPIDRTVEPGEIGRLVVTRIDHTVFLPNIVERDLARAVPAPREVRAAGFAPIGLADPRPRRRVESARGIY